MQYYTVYGIAQVSITENMQNSISLLAMFKLPENQWEFCVQSLQCANRKKPIYKHSGPLASRGLEGPCTLVNRLLANPAWYP